MRVVCLHCVAADAFLCCRYVDGQLRAKYGDAFIRGNNVM
jgi:hypothetical protein